MTKEEVHIYVLEKGSFLREEADGDVEGRLVESLMDCRKSPDQHVKMIS